MRLIVTLFRREWLEALRDRRTIMVMVVVPLVFYPLAMGMMGFFGARQQLEMEQRELKVGVLGGKLEALPGEGLRIDELELAGAREAVMEGGFDLVIEIEPADPRATWRLHYRNTLEGEAALARVRAAVDELEARAVRQHFVELGEPEAAADPIEVEVIDHAPVRETAGSRVGGIFGYFLVFLGFTGCLATAVDTGAGEKERGVFEAMLASSVPRGQLVLGKGLFVFSAGLLSMGSSLAGLGGLLLLGMAGMGLPASIIDWGAVLTVLALTLVTLLFTSSLLVGISLLSQNTKQAQSYTSPVFLGVSLALIFALLPGTQLSGMSLMMPVLSGALAIRDSITGELSPVAAVGVFASHLLLAALWLGWVTKRLRGEASLLGSS